MQIGRELISMRRHTFAQVTDTIRRLSRLQSLPVKVGAAAPMAAAPRSQLPKVAFWYPAKPPRQARQCESFRQLPETSSARKQRQANPQLKFTAPSSPSPGRIGPLPSKARLAALLLLT